MWRRGHQLGLLDLDRRRLVRKVVGVGDTDEISAARDRALKPADPAERGAGAVETEAREATHRLDLGGEAPAPELGVPPAAREVAAPGPAGDVQRRGTLGADLVEVEL